MIKEKVLISRENPLETEAAQHNSYNMKKLETQKGFNWDQSHRNMDMLEWSLYEVSQEKWISHWYNNTNMSLVYLWEEMSIPVSRGVSRYSKGSQSLLGNVTGTEP